MHSCSSAPSRVTQKSLAVLADLIVLTLSFIPVSFFTFIYFQRLSQQELTTVATVACFIGSLAGQMGGPRQQQYHQPTYWLTVTTQPHQSAALALSGTMVKI